MFPEAPSVTIFEYQSAYYSRCGCVCTHTTVRNGNFSDSSCDGLGGELGVSMPVSTVLAGASGGPARVTVDSEGLRTDIPGFRGCSGSGGEMEGSRRDRRSLKAGMADSMSSVLGKASDAGMRRAVKIAACLDVAVNQCAEDSSTSMRKPCEPTTRCRSGRSPPVLSSSPLFLSCTGLGAPLALGIA